MSYLIADNLSQSAPNWKLWFNPSSAPCWEGKREESHSGLRYREFNRESKSHVDKQSKAKQNKEFIASRRAQPSSGQQGCHPELWDQMGSAPPACALLQGGAENTLAPPALLTKTPLCYRASSTNTKHSPVPAPVGKKLTLPQPKSCPEVSPVVLQDL